MKWTIGLAVAAAVGGFLLVRSVRSSSSDWLDAATVAGIESVHIDGRPYYFGFSYSADQVVSPLFEDADAMAAYAAQHLTQRDGRKGTAFWRDMAQASLQESSLSDLEGTVLDLHGLRHALAELRRDTQTARQLPALAMSGHLSYLLEANAQWPEADRPAPVTAAAQRLGLETDDTSAWLELTSAHLATGGALPPGADFSDAATVYLWYVDTLLRNSRHDWSQVLALRMSGG